MKNGIRKAAKRAKLTAAKTIVLISAFFFLREGPSVFSSCLYAQNLLRRKLIGTDTTRLMSGGMNLFI